MIILSYTVAAGICSMVRFKILPQEALKTADFIDKFDKLFDIFNSSTRLSGNAYKNPITHGCHQLEFLEQLLPSLKTVQKPSAQKLLPCVEGWVIAIGCLRELWQDLHVNHGVQKLCTNRINQDSLENFFSMIRGKGGHRDNPDPVQFLAAYRALCVDSMLFKVSLVTVKRTSILLF